MTLAMPPACESSWQTTIRSRRRSPSRPDSERQTDTSCCFRHPMHLHGFNMFILAEGEGDWDGKIVNSWNPLRRDVILVGKNGYVVVQFQAGENPGRQSHAVRAYKMRFLILTGPLLA